MRGRLIGCPQAWFQADGRPSAPVSPGAADRYAISPCFCFTVRYRLGRGCTGRRVQQPVSLYRPPLRPNDGVGTTKVRVSLIDRYLARSIAVPLLGTLILAAMLQSGAEIF